jgi:hypothetical protein
MHGWNEPFECEESPRSASVDLLPESTTTEYENAEESSADIGDMGYQGLSPFAGL